MIVSLIKEINSSKKQELTAKIHHRFGDSSVRVNKWDKARINYEYALMIYKERNNIHEYEVIKTLYENIINIKRDLDLVQAARESCVEYIAYIKSIIA